MTSSTLLGSQCLFQGERYIRQFPAPMAVYPLRIVLGSSFHMQHLAEVGLQILFYATPIIYPADSIKGSLGQMISFNPLTAFIELLRTPLLKGEFPPLSLYLAAVISTSIFAGAATFTLVRLQKTIIFQL